ncbi:hypothetical protein D3C80_1802850 [compost metagenome]
MSNPGLRKKQPSRTNSNCLGTQNSNSSRPLLLSGSMRPGSSKANADCLTLAVIRQTNRYATSTNPRLCSKRTRSLRNVNGVALEATAASYWAVERAGAYSMLGDAAGRVRPIRSRPGQSK